MHEKSLEALDRLANDSSLTENQKNVVNELTVPVKRLIAMAPMARLKLDQNCRGQEGSAREIFAGI